MIKGDYHMYSFISDITDLHYITNFFFNSIPLFDGRKQ